ncbi:cell division protein FtsW [Sphingomonas sp. AP4-R1]|uniref:peptidoglycan glycosyltransferase FtsW n=1 Tax=Sphingomonas sp. AP4-R1 TaxID=2735134 RepID=UPI0014936862|nr:putative peptidoglycan glycosyltransferase FtsW [Sphingomonas sp. AP4-R1]QJU57829.1 cell division protein FtsW [Sphingomonas sp. AP4-R1]
MASVVFDPPPTPSRRPVQPKRRGDRFGRGDRSAMAVWFWEIDRVLLALVTVLIGIGLIAVAAAAPAAAHRYSDATHAMPTLYYFWRQLMWTALAVPVLIATSMLPKDLARRLALLGAAVFTMLLILVPILGGAEKNGAQRWIFFGPVQVQPSEFLKPMFVVAVAWMLSLRKKDQQLPMVPMTFLYLGLIGAFLMKQPDLGQTVIFASVWLCLLTLSGFPVKYLGMIGAGGVAALGCAYMFYSVARVRIDGFLKIGEAGKQVDSYQVESAYNTLTNGGLVGMGPGAGIMKFRLPEPHTDYIYSVIGEEFGLIACLAIALIYLAIVMRVFLKLLHEEDEFLFFASAGLVTQFGLQALINMMVNVHLAPSKGMTLPFISYGGSSMIALSLGFGLLLAFTRKNPYLTRSPYIVTWNAGMGNSGVGGAERPGR